ncbi:Ig-like domain-containing protein [Mangrovivirga sp. M17]|uniref:Ig-like domain-containing protein n=1 Tax=Mangrovivirga halotolerans TaxID=2993936 RepID=A0ABT3RQU4_9BACT|nr:Ig-like domain-containing protein [Mangrovivirga halotolerans]MCX2743632.1 Ig-like domain-containing protein [Mangrovivirga halotolerans]
MRYLYLLSFLILIIPGGCSEDENQAPEINLISSTINGSSLQNGMTGVSPTAEIVLTFSSAIDLNAFRNNFSISSGTQEADYSLSLQNASTRITVQLGAEYNTTYDLILNSAIIGSNGGVLSGGLNLSFTTAENDLINDPCLSGGNCENTFTIIADDNTESYFNYYANYPLQTELGISENITKAIIVIHGINRNGDDYFNYLSNTLSELNMHENTLLISPSFEETPQSNGFNYWSGSGWRSGGNSSNSTSISSFTVIDKMVGELLNNSNFPNLTEIVVTGHSSGGLFTHLYSSSSKVEDPVITYMVANSQFFYYPDARRYNESTSSFYTVENCTGIDFWPYGYSATPAYLSGVSKESFDLQWRTRNVIYLLGNGDQADPTLNTDDCQAIVLGSTRFNRGKNILRYLNNFYPNSNAHSEIIVEGIGHDGQGMYSSEEFKNWLGGL